MLRWRCDDVNLRRESVTWICDDAATMSIFLSPILSVALTAHQKVTILHLSTQKRTFSQEISWVTKKAGQTFSFLKKVTATRIIVLSPKNDRRCKWEQWKFLRLSFTHDLSPRHRTTHCQWNFALVLDSIVVWCRLFQYNFWFYSQCAQSKKVENKNWPQPYKGMKLFHPLS